MFLKLSKYKEVKWKTHIYMHKINQRYGITFAGPVTPNQSEYAASGFKNVPPSYNLTQTGMYGFDVFQSPISTHSEPYQRHMAVCQQRARRSYPIRRGCRTSRRYNGLHCAESSAESFRPSEQGLFFSLYIKKVFPFVSYDCQKLGTKSFTLEISSMRRGKKKASRRKSRVMESVPQEQNPLRCWRRLI